DYLEVIAILLAANDDVPLWARKRVKAMADFLARLLHPDGEVPLFHGATLGVARPARELLATAAIVLHEPELAPPGDLPGVWPLLVVGDAGRRTHAHLPRRREGVDARALGGARRPPLFLRDARRLRAARPRPPPQPSPAGVLPPGAVLARMRRAPGQRAMGRRVLHPLPPRGPAGGGLPGPPGVRGLALGRRRSRDRARRGARDPHDGRGGDP